MTGPKEPIPPWLEDPTTFKFFMLSKRDANRNHSEANLLFQESIAYLATWASKEMR